MRCSMRSVICVSCLNIPVSWGDVTMVLTGVLQRHPFTWVWYCFCTLEPSMTSWQAKGSKLTSLQVSSFSSPRTVSCWKSIISMATVWSPPPCDRHGSFPRWAPRPLPYCEVKGRWWQMGTLKTCKKWLDVNDFQVNWGHHTVIHMNHGWKLHFLDFSCICQVMGQLFVGEIPLRWTLVQFLGYQSWFVQWRLTRLSILGTFWS